MAGWVLRGCPSHRHAPTGQTIAWPTNPAGFLLLTLWLYLLVAAAQGLGLHRAEAMASLRQVLVMLPTVVVGVGWFAAQGEAGQRHLMRGMAFVGGAIGGLGVAEFLLRRDLLVPGVDSAGGMFRINGVAPNPIVYGLHLAWSLPFAFGMIASERRTTGRAAGVLCLAAIVAAGFLTLNRQTWVVMAVTSVGALVLMRGRWIAYMALGGALALLAAAPVVAPKVIARFAIMADLHYDTSFKYRRDNFRVAANILEHHPLTGLGLGQYPHNWRDYLLPDLFYLQYERPERPFYIDMGYMQVAAEAGLLGLGLLLLLHAAAGARLLACYARAPAPQRTWWAVLLLTLGVVMLSSLTQDTLLRPRLWIAWSLACCWAASASAESGESSAEYT
jgi:O-antigen ligase